MRPILVDKIASVTMNCELRREVRVGDEYPCRSGDVIAVRVLTSKSAYNSLELASGRFSALKQGDVVAGALGHRNALQGYAGTVPSHLKTGDKINILNLGGVLGVCESYSPLVGAPHECEVLGAVLEFPELHSRKGTPANIASRCAPLDQTLQPGIPSVIAIIGSSMNSGKTEACITIIQQLVKRGLRVAAAKATGVSLQRDTLGMEDAGACKTLTFTELGVVTTSSLTAAPLAKTMLNRLAHENPDVIVMELGDGLIGDYGVSAILADPEIAQKFTNIVFAATDPVGAVGGVNILAQRFSIQPTLITGPTTDNSAGISILERELGMVGLNARHHPTEIAELLLPLLEPALV